jgi:hypothetical protein
LYLRQDDESEVIAYLKGGTAFELIAQGVGKELWYMVKTQDGAIGWVRSSDVAASEQLKRTFKESQPNTWSATAATGRAFGGTWTVDAGASVEKASGSWTLSDEKGGTAMSGTWSASKTSKTWNGNWRARVESRSGEYSGTWSARVELKPGGRLSELFEAAIRGVVTGGWNAGAQSGSWSIQAFE